MSSHSEKNHSTSPPSGRRSASTFGEPLGGRGGVYAPGWASLHSGLSSCFLFLKSPPREWKFLPFLLCVSDV